MSSKAFELELRAANPLARPALAALDLAAGEAALGQGLLGDAVLAGDPDLTGRRPRRRSRRPRRVVLALAAVAALAVVAVVALRGGADSGSPTPAYGARLVRFAESTPLLLLEAPGWRVVNVDEIKGGEGMIGFNGDYGGPADQQWLQLTWAPAAGAKERMRIQFHPLLDRTPAPAVTTRIPSLGASVHIDPRAESAPRYGHPGDHEMVAIWTEGGHTLMALTRVPSVAAFRERLEALHRVDAQTWLAAMPAEVVKAHEYGAAVQAMLRGIPRPPGFDPATIPNLELTTDRYQVGAQVGGAVACAWFGYWGKARAEGDTAGASEAERILLGAERQWPIFRQMATEGGYPATVTEYARKMKTGTWFGKPLLRAIFSAEGMCPAR